MPISLCHVDCAASWHVLDCHNAQVHKFLLLYGHTTAVQCVSHTTRVYINVAQLACVCTGNGALWCKRFWYATHVTSEGGKLQGAAMLLQHAYVCLQLCTES